MPNESWRYADLDLDFHFVVDEDASGNNWRLAPALTSLSMVTDRMHWGRSYLAMAWQEIAYRTSTIRPSAPLQPDDALIQQADFIAPPDSYRESVHALARGTDFVGGYRFTAELPAFDRGELAVSDIVPAYGIATDDDVPESRSDVRIRAKPFAAFSTDQLVDLYFEIYGLTFGNDDRTDYSLDITLAPADEASFLRRLFGRGTRPSLTLKTAHSGSDASQIEGTALDVHDVYPGRYVLTVRGTDEHTGATAERARTIELVD